MQTYRSRHTGAFTLVELLVGLIVTSIILSAVATLAFALSSATRASDNLIYTQTQLRSATPRILDTIRYSRMICAQFSGNLVFWRTDANQNDQIDVNELLYLEYDDPNDLLRLYEFDVQDDPSVLAALGLPLATPVVTELAKPATKTSLVNTFRGSGELRRGTILAGCQNVNFFLDQNPPRTRRLTISFDLVENDGTHRYELDAVMRVSAAHLLSADATGLVPDDD